MSSNSAVLVRLYPNAHQAELFRKVCRYRMHYYNGLAMWWNTTYRACKKRYAQFCEKEADETKRKEFSKSLPWPPKKVTKEGLNDTCLKVIFDDVPKRMRFAVARNFTATVKSGKAKGTEKNYGDVFRLNALYMQAQFGKSPASSDVAAWCKDDFARAVKMTFSKDRTASCIHSKRPDQADTFKTCMSQLDARYDARGRVKAIRIPFLSGDKRKSEHASTEWVKCSLSDTLLSEAQSVSAITVTQRNGKWYGALSVYAEPKTHSETGMECGIDLGIKTCATAAFAGNGTVDASSDSHEKFDMPTDKIKRLESRIEFYQKAQMRRVKTWMRLNADGIASGLKLNTARGDNQHNAIYVYRKHYQSRAYMATERMIARAQDRIRNIRKNWHEQFSRRIADRCDFVGLEDLNVSGMVKNSRLARHIERVGFYGLRTCIERKVGIDRVSYLNRFAPSSKMCSVCGYRNTELTLSDREWTCPECGAHHDRDANAATNIRPSRQRETESCMPQRG